MQHGLATVGDEREKSASGISAESRYSPWEVGVEDCDNADCDQVVDHSQGQRKTRIAEEGGKYPGGENRHRERNIGWVRIVQPCAERWGW